MSLVWTIRYDERALKELKKLDRQAQKRIVEYFDIKIAPLKNAREQGKALTGSQRGLWRYRIGDYRAICHIKDETVTVLILRVAHRKEVYD